MYIDVLFWTVEKGSLSIYIDLHVQKLNYQVKNVVSGLLSVSTINAPSQLA